jgi:drug/metabolite transporter (DMT)-like permease
MKSHTHFVSGTLFALAAGLMWGLVFVAPLMLPEYPAALLSVSRYLAFGLIALPLAWVGRARLSQLTRHLLPVPGRGDPAYRRAAADDDHRHAAGGDCDHVEPAPC